MSGESGANHRRGATPAGLSRCDPRTRVVVFVLLAGVVMARPLFSPAWGGAAVLVLWGVREGGDFFDWVRQLRRLRWFFVVLMGVHGLLTPGEAIFPGSAFPTWQGVGEGGGQAVRLVLLVTLAWTLARTTPAAALLGAFDRLLSPWHGMGARRGLALLAAVAGNIPRLSREVVAVREALSLRLPPPVGWWGRWERLALAGEALLFRVLWHVQRQHEALRARGFGERELPFLVQAMPGFGWRDGLLVLLALFPVFWPH